MEKARAPPKGRGGETGEEGKTSSIYQGRNQPFMGCTGQKSRIHRSGHDAGGKTSISMTKAEPDGRTAPCLRHAGRKVLCPAVDAGECPEKRIRHSPLNAAYRGTPGKRIGMEARENGEDIPREREVEKKCLFERLVFRTRPEMGEIHCREVHGEPLRLALAILENGADALHGSWHSLRGIWTGWPLDGRKRLFPPKNGPSIYLGRAPLWKRKSRPCFRQGRDEKGVRCRRVSRSGSSRIFHQSYSRGALSECA